jgi:hypothetical protein
VTPLSCYTLTFISGHTLTVISSIFYLKSFFVLYLGTFHITSWQTFPVTPWHLPLPYYKLTRLSCYTLTVTSSVLYLDSYLFQILPWQLSYCVLTHFSCYAFSLSPTCYTLLLTCWTNRRCSVDMDRRRYCWSRNWLARSVMEKGEKQEYYVMIKAQDKVTFELTRYAKVTLCDFYSVANWVVSRGCNGLNSFWRSLDSKLYPDTINVAEFHKGFRSPYRRIRVKFVGLFYYPLLSNMSAIYYSSQHSKLYRRTGVSAMLRRVALVRTEVSEELSASIISVTRIGILIHRFLSPCWWRCYVPSKCLLLQEPHDVTSQKTPFFIVTAVKTTSLTKLYSLYISKASYNIP